MPRGLPGAPSTRVVWPRGAPWEGVTSEISIAMPQFSALDLVIEGRKSSTRDSREGMSRFWGLAGRLEADLVHF
jgi:hypothetical protein